MDNPIVKGGSFLIEDLEPQAIFTPEDFTEDHRMIGKTARDFIDREVMPKLSQIEEQQWDITLGLMKKAGELGLLSVDVPEKYGGLGLDKTSSMLVAEAFGKSGSFAVTYGDQTGIGTLPIVFFGTEQQKEKYLAKFATAEWFTSYSLTEPNSGSDAISIRTTAALSPDKKYYTLNGSKNFLTNAGIADFYITFAKIDGQQFTSFIVPKGLPGITLGKEEKKMGIKGSSTRTMILENVQVPVENVLGEIGKGHKIAFNILNFGRFKLGASAIGGSKGVIADAIKYAKTRKQFGKAIAEFGLIQHKLAEMAIRIFAGESMVYRTAGLIDTALAHVNREGADASTQILKGIEEYAVECSILKVAGSEILDYVVDEGVQIFGGYGFMEEYPVARPYRDSRINRIFEGTNEINRLLITGMLLKRAMKGELPLMQKAQQLIGEITGFQDDADSSDMRLVRGAKKTALFAAGIAVQKYGTAFEEEQEVIGHISDIIMQIYAMESVLLRVQKMKEAAPIYQDIVRTFVNDAILQIEIHAKQILAAVAEGDSLKTYLLALRKLLKHTPINTIPCRRRIAAQLLERESYLV